MFNLKILFKLGIYRSTIIITIVSILFSNLFTYLTMNMFNMPNLVLGLLIASIIPIIVAPLSSWFILKLLFKIETMNNSLEMKVQMRTKELQELNNNLYKKIEEEILKRKEKEKLLLQQTRLAEMGKTISMIAHQWRQPLTSLNTIIQNVYYSYKLDKLDEKYMEEQIKLGQDLINNMSQVIETFRNFFKPNREKSNFSLKNIINDNIFLIKDSLQSNNIEILADIFDDDIIVYGYQNELSQALFNIITNSKDALIQNNTSNKSIKINLNLTTTGVVISIIDNGGGIDKDILENIFDPYFSTKDEKNGTGLGLYISKLIIESMEGTICAQNWSKGVQFIIKIPHKVIKS